MFFAYRDFTERQTPSLLKEIWGVLAVPHFIDHQVLQ